MPAAAAASDAAASVTVPLNLRAQLWSGPALRARPIGAPKPVTAALEIPTAQGSGHRSVFNFIEGDLELQVTFLLVRPRTGAEAYAVAQTRLTHATKGLVAECSNYDSLASRQDIGVGACSGAIDGLQVGVSYFR